MHHSIVQSTYLTLALIFISLTNLQGQDDTTSFEYAAFINGSFGALNSFNHDYNSMDQPGQDLLGRTGGAWEKGVEILIPHKSGIVLRLNTNSSRSIFGEMDRDEENHIEGTWFGRGQSVSIGYGILERTNQNKYAHFYMSIGYGKYTSSWDFINTASFDDIAFGDYILQPGEQNRFSSNNDYIDLNVFVGRLRLFNQGQSPLFWNNGLSLGYRHSIHRNTWKSESTGNEIMSLNPTAMSGWYFNYSIGLGYLKK